MLLPVCGKGKPTGAMREAVNRVMRLRWVAGGGMLWGMSHTVVPRIPTLEEYRRLCRAVGWEDVMNFSAAEQALPRSLYAVVAEVNGVAVGMGQIVGDGAIFFYVQDVAVDPDHQGQGIGAAILSALVGWARETAPDKAFLGVFAVKGTEPFYEREGFAAYAHDIGMFQVLLSAGG